MQNRMAKKIIALEMAHKNRDERKPIGAMHSCNYKYPHPERGEVVADGRK